MYADQEPVISKSILKLFYYLALLIAIIAALLASVIAFKFILPEKSHVFCDCQWLVILILGLYAISTGGVLMSIRPPRKPGPDPQ